MTQYYSRIDTEFNGDVYSIPFSYINENEINVYINDELWEDWEFLNASQIKLLELPSDLPANSIITIQRNTNIEEKVVDFTNNTMLSESALDLSNDQFLYSIQEVYDDVSKFKIDVQEDVDKKVEAVSEAVSKINALEEAVVTATDAAQVASEQAEIATTSSNEAKDLIDTSIGNITATSEEAIRNIYTEAQRIVDTGIDSRATVDLDNITAEAEKVIQHQAKLANASFCANSGNVENGNADLLYLPSYGDIEIAWQNPTLKTLTDYGTVTGSGLESPLYCFNGDTNLQVLSTGETTVTWEFPQDKRIFLNATNIYWGGAGGYAGGCYSGTLKLYYRGELVRTINNAHEGSGLTGWTKVEFEKTQCDKIVFWWNGYDHATVPSRMGEIQLLGTEIITVSTSTECYFKVGGEYPNLVATSTEKTFEKSYLKPITAEADGIYNVFISETVNPYALANTIYRQKTEPKTTKSNITTTVKALTDENHVISGFTATNYADTGYTFAANGKPWEINVKFTTGSTMGTFQNILNSNNNSDYRPIGITINKANKMMLVLSNSTSTLNIAFDIPGTQTITANTTYWCKLIFDGSKYELSLSDDGKEYVTDITVDSAQIVRDGVPLVFSHNNTTYPYPFKGSIDLNECNIKIDGETVWQGVIPTNINTVWLDTSVQPYKAYKFNGTEWEDFKDVPIGSMVVEGGIITSVETFDYNLTFKKVTSNMPSSRVIDLTLGASGSTYTAPANGWFYLNKVAGGDWYYCEFTNAVGGTWGIVPCWGSEYRTSPIKIWTPVRKGAKIKVNYNATGATNYFKFIYAEGEE